MSIMLRDVPQAFRDKLQHDNVELAELIDLTLPNGKALHWTTSNHRITWTRSGVPTEYDPFPGNPGSGISEDTQLGVSNINFTIANSNGDIRNQLISTDFALAKVDIGRVFTDTPDLGRMMIYAGKMGDFAYNRSEITGEARNIWKSLNVQWPYYTYNDNCVWRFGSTGCGFNTQSVTLNGLVVDVASSTTLDITVESLALSNSFANGRFEFGRLTVATGVNSGLVRSIRAHNGDTLSLSYPLPNGDLTGMTIDIFPGCKKRLTDDCTSLYNNAKNFLGFPWIPQSEDAY